MLLQINRPGRLGTRGSPPPLPAAILRGLLLAVLISGVAACTDGLSRVASQGESCVRKRLAAAVISYEDAKSQFAEHFKLRTDTSLRFAYQASVDSTRLALSIRSCFDFDRSFIPEARDVLRSNRIFRRLVRSNLRDPDPQQAIGVFGDQYREIFKNDIN